MQWLRSLLFNLQIYVMMFIMAVLFISKAMDVS